MPNSTYCELTAEQEREALGNEEFLELLVLHHLGAYLCGLRGSEIDVRFVSEDGDGACHRTGVPALGFVYKYNPGSSHVRTDQPREQRHHVLLHECRHQFQFIQDVPLHTEEAEEADAEGFARHYTPKVRPILSGATRAAAEMLARRAIDAQPSHLTVRTDLDELAETVVEEVGLDRAFDVLFVDDPAQVGRSAPRAIARRVAEKTLQRDDVRVTSSSKGGCGCGCGGPT